MYYLTNISKKFPEQKLFEVLYLRNYVGIYNIFNQRIYIKKIVLSDTLQWQLGSRYREYYSLVGKYELHLKK